jgi:tripartite-type tricarboxylate transporter receptor subunit TctC
MVAGKNQLIEASDNGNGMTWDTLGTCLDVGCNGALLLLVTLVLFQAGAALAQPGWPNRPVRMVVPGPAGGGADIIARIVVARLAERLGQQVIIDNRAGAGSMIGDELVAKSAPDGYTLLLGTAALATNPAIYKDVRYDARRDFAPVTLAILSPNILVVHPSLPVKTVKELIAFAQAHPGQMNFASAGTGTNPHLSMELFLSMAKLTMVHVPYKGSSPAIVDLIAGHVAVMTSTILTAIPHVRSGRMRALGVTGAKRLAALPEVPTIAEAALPGYEAVQWYGILAPAKTPEPIVLKLNSDIVRVLQSPDVRAKLVNDGAEPAGNTPDEFARFIRSETEKWARVARAAGIKPE